MAKNSIKTERLLEQEDLELVTCHHRQYLTNRIQHPRAQKPGLALTGYIQYLDHKRIQLFGKTEIGYLNQLPQEDLARVLKNFFAKKIPAIVVSESQEVSPSLIQLAGKYKTPILVSSLSTSILHSRISGFLYRFFSKKIRINGTMLAIKGLGVLITGNSGVGKSETALELVNKGYQLVSDDLVEFYLNANDDPVGRSVKPIKQWLEVRGIGVINLVSLYGVSVVIEEQKLDLVINLEKWNPRKKYDRLGENQAYFEVLGRDIPRLNFPVAAGRNVSTLIEVAVKYYISRRKGIVSFLEYSECLKAGGEKGSK